MLESYKYDLIRTKAVGHKRYCRKFLWLLRHAQETNFYPLKSLFRLLFHLHALMHNNEIGSKTQIGAGLCLWHPYNITISPSSVLAKMSR